MRKKIIKMLETALPNEIYDYDGNVISKKETANKLYDKIEGIERLDLLPFEQWVPFACSTCHYNDARKLGCTYELYNETTHMDKRPPGNCPLKYNKA